VSRHHARFRSLEELWLVLMTELHHRSIDRVGRAARALLTRAPTSLEASHA
jgi:hypothetical protein